MVTSSAETTADPACAEDQLRFAQLPQGDSGEVWEVQWCYNGWDEIAVRLEKLLPPWAVLRKFDPSRPLHTQCSEHTRVIIPTTGTVDAAAIAASPNLKLIAQPAAGYNNVDIEAAKARGVPVTLAPGYNSQSTAEVALVMMLMLSRRIDEARRVLAEGVIGQPAGHVLFGRQLGVVGMGKVGTRLARAAEGLGMTVVGVRSGSSRQELEALLKESDVVSLHTPLTPATEGLIGETELAMMKPGALLINVARGPVIKKEALLAALQSGHLGGAGLDVHWVEPPCLEDPLYQHPAVLSLPHLGSTATEVYDDFARVLAENVVRVRKGQPLLHQLC